MQPRAVHTVSQSTRLSSKSSLTSELDPVPAQPPPEHPACPPHPRPACPGPWKSPSLSGPQVLSWGQAREEARWAVRIGQGGGERGGPAEPKALSPQPRPPWPPDPPRSSVAPSASSGPLHYPRSLSLLCSPSSSVESQPPLPTFVLRGVSGSSAPLRPPWSLRLLCSPSSSVESQPPLLPFVLRGVSASSAPLRPPRSQPPLAPSALRGLPGLLHPV